MKILIFFIFSLIFSQHLRWVYYYNGPINNMDNARLIVYGLDNNIYATGISSGIGWDIVVISLTNEGEERWVYRYNGPGNYNDEAMSIIYGLDNNIYVAGWSEGIGSSEDFTVISLTNEGEERWVYRYNGPGNYNDEATSIIYGLDNNIYAAGYNSDSLPLSFFITVASLDTNGNERFLYKYGKTYSMGWSIAYGLDNNIYIAGETYHDSTNFDLTVISLNPEVAIKENKNIKKERLFIRSITKEKIIFSLSLPYPTILKVSLYNLLGKKVFSFVLKAKEGENLYEKNLPSLSEGIYFLTIKSKDYKENKKIIIK